MVPLPQCQARRSLVVAAGQLRRMASVRGTKVRAKVATGVGVDPLTPWYLPPAILPITGERARFSFDEQSYGYTICNREIQRLREADGGLWVASIWVSAGAGQTGDAKAVERSAMAFSNDFHV
jgi:hypothetical protein